jgi:multidrug efflux system membrane fusion protein
VPATALFHDGTQPAVWVVRAADNALELRRVTVTRYNERTIVISPGHQGRRARRAARRAHGDSRRESPPIAPLHPEDFAS